MPRTLRVSKTYQVLNETTQYGQQTDVPADNLTEASPLISVAKVGQLTTRTSTSAGNITFVAGHGFVATNLIDLFWGSGAIAGKRVGVILGVAAGDVFPISGGAGDDLPANLTAVTAMLRHSEDRVFTGNDVQWMLLTSPVPAWVTFTQTDGTTVIVSIPLTADAAGVGTRYTYSWDIQTNPTGNPLAGGAVGKILMSHGDSGNIREVTAKIGTN